MSDRLEAADSAQWAPALRPWRRCRARLQPGAYRAGPYHGRCELRRHPDAVAHALERGMDVVRWRTDVQA